MEHEEMIDEQDITAVVEAVPQDQEAEVVPLHQARQALDVAVVEDKAMGAEQEALKAERQRLTSLLRQAEMHERGSRMVAQARAARAERVQVEQQLAVNRGGTGALADAVASALYAAPGGHAAP